MQNEVKQMIFETFTLCHPMAPKFIIEAESGLKIYTNA